MDPKYPPQVWILIVFRIRFWILAKRAKSICNSCKSFAYLFRWTRETLYTVLFTIRKFVFTVTLIHECSQCSIP